MSGKQGGSAPRVPPESFYCIFEFMSSREGLALKGVELAVYALVYSYSQGKGGCYYGSNAMTAHRAGCSERHAIDVVHALEERGLIVNVGEHRRLGRATNMYVAAPGPVAEAIARCGGAPTPEAGSPRATGAPEPGSPVPPKGAQGCPERTSPDMKGIETHTKDGVARAGGGGVDRAFHEVLRAYPYARDRAEALALYRPLYEEGVRAADIARALRDWEALHPARDGRRPFYPELASFLDPNNPEGYRALAEKAAAREARKRASRVRDLTLNCSPDEMYERYALDGCDAKATELYRAHLDSGERRGERWDRWYAYMFLKHDLDAREHWVEATGLGGGGEAAGGRVDGRE